MRRASSSKNNRNRKTDTSAVAAPSQSDFIVAVQLSLVVPVVCLNSSKFPSRSTPTQPNPTQSSPVQSNQTKPNQTTPTADNVQVMNIIKSTPSSVCLSSRPSVFSARFFEQVNRRNNGKKREEEQERTCRKEEREKNALAPVRPFMP